MIFAEERFFHDKCSYKVTENLIEILIQVLYLLEYWDKYPQS